jgi:signal transduction histidine kinase
VNEALHWITEAPGDVVPLAPAQEADLSSGPSPLNRSATVLRPHVLWADDNSDMREYVRRLLADHYEVTAVSDGEKAVAAALGTPFDLVLSDVMMPGLDGFGVLRRLRADERTKTIPVILLSARAGEESAVEGLGAGADDYLVKPFSARELLARVRTHLELAKLRRRWALELEAANKQLEAFSFSVSHDLRAPLRGINGFGKLLAESCDGQLGSQGHRLLGMIQSEAKKMGHLIDALLDFSRVGRQPFKARALDMTHLAQTVFDELIAQSTGRKVKLKLEPLPATQGDPILMRQVFVNLLSNAIKFTGRREGAVIEIGGHNNGQENEYYIKDNGAGFDPKYTDKLFGVFQRLHPAEEFEGTGVGLSIVHRIIHRHGGRIWAKGEEDKGATFHFALPVRG